MEKQLVHYLSSTGNQPYEAGELQFVLQGWEAIPCLIGNRIMEPTPNQSDFCVLLLHWVIAWLLAWDKWRQMRDVRREGGTLDSKVGYGEGSLWVY